MTVITKTELENASLDASSLADFVNAVDGEVIPRIGMPYPNVRRIVNEVLDGGGLRIFPDEATLQAYEPELPTMALVMSDPVMAWKYEGSLPWVEAPEYFGSVFGDTSRLLSMTEAREVYIGRQNTPQSGGTSTGTFTAIINQPLPTSGSSKKIEIYGGSSSGTVYLKAMRLTVAENGDKTFDQIGSDFAVSVSANSLTTVSTDDFEITGGDYLSLYAQANTFTITNDPPSDNVNWFYKPGNVSTAEYDAADTGSTSRLEIRVTFDTLAIKQDILENNDFVPATGNDEIARSYSIEGDVKAQIGFQNVDAHNPQSGFFRVITGDGLGSWDFTPYQYGVAIVGRGAHGETMELQLEDDNSPTSPPEFSVRHRTGGNLGDNLGARIQARNSNDHVGYGLNFQNDSDPHIWMDNHADTPLTMGYYHPLANGAHVFKIGGTQKFRVTATGMRATLPTYADNAAAISGGLVANDMYKTATGEVRIVV